MPSDFKFDSEIKLNGKQRTNLFAEIAGQERRARLQPFNRIAFKMFSSEAWFLHLVEPREKALRTGSAERRQQTCLKRETASV